MGASVDRSTILPGGKGARTNTDPACVPRNNGHSLDHGLTHRVSVGLTVTVCDLGMDPQGARESSHHSLPEGYQES